MGCDIHLFTERKRTVNGKEAWINCDNWKLNPYYDKEDGDGESEYIIKSICSDRNYHLFSVLADVRNYSGNKTISDPKGIPDDVSKIIKKESDRWDCDGHSHSYFTLFELKEFGEQKTKYSGWMHLEDAEKVDSGEMPNSWCQGTNAENYVFREWERDESPLDSLIERLEKLMKEEFYIWDDKRHIETEKKIRIVFWFDN